MIKAIRRLKVPDTNKDLFKAVSNHLQVERHIRKAKIYKVSQPSFMRQKHSTRRGPGRPQPNGSRHLYTQQHQLNIRRPI